MIITVDKTIKELEENGIISARTYNGLNNAGIVDIQGLLSYLDSGNQISNIRNLGRKSEFEISKIKSHFSSILYKDKYISIEIEIQDIFKNALDQFIDQKCDSTYFASIYKNRPLILYKSVIEFKDRFEIFYNLTKQENISYRKTCCDFVEFLVNALNNNSICITLVEQYKVILENMKKFSSLTLNEDLKFLSEVHHLTIQQEFVHLCNKYLGVRAKNFISTSIPTYDFLVPLFDKSLKEYNKSLCPCRTFSKTLREIQQFNIIFKERFFKLYNLSDNDIYVYQLKKKYPYLLEKQRQFVVTFEKENGYTPLYMLLYNYLRYSEDKTDQLYSLHYGLFDNRPKTLDELAKMYSLTRERVRQIIHSSKPAKSIIINEDKYIDSYSDLFKLNIITDNSIEFRMIIEKEKLHIPFSVFASLTSILSEYTIENVKDVTILLSTKYNENVNIKEITNKLEYLLSARYPKDTVVPIDTILVDVPHNYLAETRDFFIWVIQNIYKQRILDTGDILLSQNYIDIEDEVFSILKHNGRPMYLKDIYYKLNQLSPDYKAPNKDKIRSYIQRSSRIKAIGRQSLYGLECWSNVFFGSIPHLLIEILTESKLPVKLNELFEKVLENFPNTNIKSVSSFMISDEQERFVLFQNNYVGLRGKPYSIDYIKQPIVQRFKFEERILMFRDFVNTYHRYPLASGGDLESSLQRWYYNIINGILEVTEDQKKNFDDLIYTYNQKEIPQTGLENEFYNNCIEYKNFMNRNHKLPSSIDGGELYTWFYRSKTKYKGFTDQRHKYMLDLFNYIISFGFTL